MNRIIESQIKQQSIQCIPNECCGFIIVDHRTQFIRTYPTKNISDFPNQAFIIDPIEFIEAEKIGKIIAYYHSHIVRDESFTDADKVNSDVVNLPSFVYSTLTDKFNFYKPSNFKPPLVGRNFVWGVFDCWALAHDYFKETCNIQISNDYFRIDNSQVIQNNYFEENYAKEGFIAHKEPLKPHDLIFMKINSKVCNHCGIYVGSQNILHHLAGRLSQRSLYGSYWKKVTALTLRHKDLW